MLSKNARVIPVTYKGTSFRSRTEARWAVFFDRIDVQWRYEHEGYELYSGRYLPDFWLPEHEWFVEVKPAVTEQRRKSLISINGYQTEYGLGEREERLCSDLALQTGFRVAIAYGSPSEHEGFEVFIPSEKSTSVDYPWYPCFCSECGLFGIEFEGKAERICGRRCDTKTKYSGDYSIKLNDAVEHSRTYSFWSPSNDDQ